MAAIPQTYVVVAGDSLSLISKKMYGDFSMVDDLAKANGISNIDLIYPGKQLIIPPAKNNTSATDVVVVDSNGTPSSSSGFKYYASKYGGWAFLGLAVALLAYEASKQHKKNKSSAKPKAEVKTA